MSIADTFLQEFEREAVTTQRFLERLPEDQLSWKPHEKSMSAGQLSLHIAIVPQQVIAMAALDEMDMSDIGGGPAEPENKQQILDTHQQSVEKMREVLPTLSDDQMAGMWKMTNAGEPMIEMPRFDLIRSIVLNHWYHHRGQFGVYLRLLGAMVPSSYGPSGDELPDFMK